MSRKPIVLVYGGSGGLGFASAGEKALTPLLGRPLAAFLMDAAAGLRPGRVILALDGGIGKEAAAGLSCGRIPLAVVGPAAKRGKASAGVGRALLAARPHLRGWGGADLVIVPADRPLIRAETLKRLASARRRNSLSLALMICGPDLERDSIAVLSASDLLAVFPAAVRARGGAGLRTLAALLAARGRRVGLTENSAAEETFRVGGRADLARAARLLRQRKNGRLARRGVTLLDPRSTWIDWEAELGAGTVVYPSVVIEGPTRIGRDCHIYPHVHIAGCRVGDRVRVLSSSVLEGSRVEDESQVGPFSRLRPGTVVRTGSKVGNFVEMKNTVFGPRSKAQHLSYLGDSRVDEDVNIGAGTITCNYDGVRKNPTRIGAGAFIGSGTELVAPVRIGRRAYIAAGSTITKDVAPGSLAIGRARQVVKPGWVAERVKKLRRKHPAR
ncbi:MAG TPA: NTP transferase domain-containing protein [Terriglobales bacterium]|nr:NTP transferase domain-containing protein [Terriglobales bacterium]